MTRPTIKAKKSKPTALSVMLAGNLGVALDDKVAALQDKKPNEFITRSYVVRVALEKMLGVKSDSIAKR